MGSFPSTAVSVSPEQNQVTIIPRDTCVIETESQKSPRTSNSPGIFTLYGEDISQHLCASVIVVDSYCSKLFISLENLVDRDVNILSANALIIVSTYQPPEVESDLHLNNMVCVNAADLAALKLGSAEQFNLDDVLGKAMNNIITMISLKELPGFIASRNNGGSTETPKVNVPISHDDRAAIAYEAFISVLKTHFATNQAITKLLSFSDIPTIQKMVTPTTWLSTLLNALENLPISCSVATSDKSDFGFPLIYVNKMFEEMTGFTLESVKGTNNKFLQGQKTEADSVQRITTALAKAQPIKVQLTNFRKNGEPFKNLVSMTPVFDLNGQYRFVIGVQFDCSNPNVNVRTMHIVDMFISLLPTICL